VETLPQIMSQYVETGLVKYSQRHMPLEQLHPNAPLEAEATFCANEQGKFWEYHDILFGEYDARNNQ
jgi:protein-disulfide isomerase